MITFTELGKKGRLGNQLFQIAALIGTARKHRVEWFLPERWEYRGRFNIPDDRFKNIKTDYTYSDEDAFHYRDVPYKGGAMNLSGYFQSYKYFENVKGLVNESFELKNMKDDTGEGCTALHVRRGDYLIHEGCYRLLGLDYYLKAIDNVSNKNILVFSDDVAYCKELFKDQSFFYSEITDPLKDLDRMMGCDTVIAANSSYSWWGGWLCGAGQGSAKVIFPKGWFGPKLNHFDTSSLCPPNWISV